MKHSAYIATRVRPELAEALAIMADRNEHSVSAEIRLALRAWLARNDERPGGPGVRKDSPGRASDASA